jgi:predicted MPP superfamily phosphohydrolase
MLTRAIHALRVLVWAKPIEMMVSIAFLCVIGVIAGTGTSVLIGQRRHKLALSMRGAFPGLVLLLFCLADWALLGALPRLRLSFSEQIAAPLLASVGLRLVILWCLLTASLLTLWRERRRSVTANTRVPRLAPQGTRAPRLAPRATRGVAILFVLANLAFSAVQVDAYVVEPLLVDTTALHLAFEDLEPGAPPVRVVHLSDTHIERSSYREASVLHKVNALQPDIIVLTGDYLNLSRLRDPVSAAHFRQFVSQLRAPYGIYAVRGSVEPTMGSMQWLIEGTHVTWLEQEARTIDVRGQKVTLIGVACSHRPDVDTARLDDAMTGVPSDAFTLLLYHSPDLIAEAAEWGIDLYLGGHTHGGQLRLPFYGAIVTGSSYGKEYESGLHQRDNTTMYISRGIGFEGGGMPRARFLCRPEIVSLELGGTQ